MKRIKTGDNVVVIAGKSKGHISKVTKVKDDFVFVEGANMIKKHVKPNPQLQQTGGIISREAPLHVSNVAHYNSITKKADKVGFKFIKNGDVLQKVRYFKSNNEVIDHVK
jgi:large subunit ribosomal protein L24